MSDYIYTNGNLISTDMLKHYKYTKKVFINGKWRYYYDNDFLDARSDNEAAKAIAEYDYKQANKTFNDPNATDKEKDEALATYIKSENKRINSEKKLTKAIEKQPEIKPVKKSTDTNKKSTSTNKKSTSTNKKQTKAEKFLKKLFGK